MNDEDIIDLFFDRKESAIFETDNKYGNHLSKLAMRILNCHEDAEECKNDTYFETWNTVPPTRPTNFLAYLMRIVGDVPTSYRIGKSLKKATQLYQ